MNNAVAIHDNLVVRISIRLVSSVNSVIKLAHSISSFKPLNKQCTSLAYQVFSILASTSPCCSHGNDMRSGFGSRNGKVALHIIHWCRNRRRVSRGSTCVRVLHQKAISAILGFMATV